MKSDRELLTPLLEPFKRAYDESKIWLVLPGYDFATMCAQCFRESYCGKYLAPDGTGDQGHGHGLFQIDDRSHMADLKTRDWRDPYVNAQMALHNIMDDRRYFFGLPTAPGVPPPMMVRLCLASFNTGPRRALNGLLHGDPDEHTTGKDYSAWILKKRSDLLVQMPELAQQPL